MMFLSFCLGKKIADDFKAEIWTLNPVINNSFQIKLLR